MKTKLLFVLLIIPAALLMAGLGMSMANAGGLAKKGDKGPTALSASSMPSSTVKVIEEFNLDDPTKPYISAMALQKYAHSEIQTQVRQGIELSVANFRIEDELLVDACFPLPDKSDWRIWRAVARVEEETLLLSTIRPLEYGQTLANGKKRITTFPPGSYIQFEEVEADEVSDYVCETLGFRKPSTDVDLSNVTLVIESIGALPREGEVCSIYFNKVQAILESRKSGIKLDCAQDEWGERIRIIEKPVTMSQEEAEQIVSSDEFFTITGPWIFKGGVK